MLDSTRFTSQPASDPHISRALAWAEKNLGSLARFTAAKMDGGDDDHVHLSATFAILRARQQIRAGMVEVEQLAREAAR